MKYPVCSSTSTREIPRTTVLGYQQFYCRPCRMQFNERTGTPLNFVEYPTEVVMLVVYYYYRVKVSLDDVVDLMTIRGIHLSHQTVHNWVQTFGVELGIKLRKPGKERSAKSGMQTPPTSKSKDAGVTYFQYSPERLKVGGFCRWDVFAGHLP